MDKDTKDLPLRYLGYSLWWVNHGSKDYESKNAEIRKLKEKFEKEGLPENDAYFKATMEVNFESHPDEDISEQVNDLCKKGDFQAFQLIREIVANSPNEENILSYIGAGLFEDWIQNADYKEFKEEVEELFDTDDKWRIVILSSWHNPEELEKKIRIKE